MESVLMETPTGRGELGLVLASGEGRRRRGGVQVLGRDKWTQGTPHPPAPCNRKLLGLEITCCWGHSASGGS